MSRDKAVRKRRAHVKSRKGCGNCKLRRVKCDEVHPVCTNCKRYGVSCDYSSLKSSLDINTPGSFQVHFASGSSDEVKTDDSNEANILSLWIPPLESVSIRSSLATIVDDSLNSNTRNLGWLSGSRRFSTDQLKIVSRFRNRTSVTIGNPQMAPVYRDLVCQLACKHAFLMHMLLSITLMHDAHLTNPSAVASKSSQEALKHWNIASKLFNEILSRPIPPSYQDAIWATGVFLGAASFWSIGSTNPYEVWPLKSAEPDDLSWLRVGEGKKHLWRLAQPRRPDSIFYDLVKDHNCHLVPEWMAIGSGLQVSDRIRKIFDITASTDEYNNVYYQPLLTLLRCPNIKLTHENALKFLYIMAVITPDFLALLEAKDVRAVFIIGWWYILLTTGDLWWMSRRARIEGRAIRIWLRRQHGGEELTHLLNEIEKRSSSDDHAAPWFFEV
ncbi:hypothetical protein M3J09_006280 [Ascochyta lentis]